VQHSEEFLAVVNDAKKRVCEISVDDTIERMERGAQLIDVREDHEWNDGHASGAIHIGKGVIERDIVKTITNKSAEIILYCGGGYRSALAADMVQKMGYTNVLSMAGGWKAWKESAAPTETDATFSPG
jgi:rhodanese-related sulfurtransferase